MINYEEQAKILISSEEKQISDQASMTIGKVFWGEKVLIKNFLGMI